MGELDAIILADADLGFSDFGESAVYIPADSGINPFPCTVKIFRERLNEYAGMGYSDRTQCEIRHAEIAAQGMEKPVMRDGNQAGDTITTHDFNGNDETWEVVGVPNPDRPAHVWELEIEKNVRFRP